MTGCHRQGSGMGCLLGSLNEGGEGVEQASGEEHSGPRQQPRESPETSWLSLLPPCFILLGMQNPPGLRNHLFRHNLRYMLIQCIYTEISYQNTVGKRQEIPTGHRLFYNSRKMVHVMLVPVFYSFQHGVGGTGAM